LIPRDCRNAPFLADPLVRQVLTLLSGEGEEARVVGGAVRNSLLDLPVADIDIATTALPDIVMARAQAAGLKTAPTGVEHGTVTVIGHRHVVEVTTLREDIETDGRRAVVRFGRDWQADAERRDFTINALSVDVEGRLHDPVGGLDDLAARRVRFIGSAERRIAEDRLRVLRFFRFHAAYGVGLPDAEGLSASIRARHDLASLSAERIGQEMRRVRSRRSRSCRRAVSCRWSRPASAISQASPACRASSRTGRRPRRCAWRHCSAACRRMSTASSCGSGFPMPNERACGSPCL
jgi:poly(A) polymerase